MICDSCNKEIINDKGTTRFKCPSCGKIEIIRCYKCRADGIRYRCKCGFEGPN